MMNIKIKGMSCGHCVQSVTKALAEIEGISDVVVNLEKGEADFMETKPVPVSSIKEAISKIGFEVVG